MRIIILFFVCVGLALPPCLQQSCCFAEDWPQWMGQNRDNIWSADNIVDEFPDKGLPVLWRTPIAGGYAGPAVVGNRLVVTDYVTADNVKVDNFSRSTFTGQERVLCLDAASGKVLWKHEYPVTYTISYPAGPRCTPNIDGDKVYTLGAEGNLICFELETGKVLWEKDFKKEYNTKAALWGYAAHPLIDGNKLICVVGGTNSQTVAFDKISGKELWKSVDSPEQGYAPPTIISAGGVRQLISVTPISVNSLNPETGDLYWTTPYEANNGSIIMSPLVVQDKYLYIGGYSNKNLLLELSADRPSIRVVWKDKNRLGISPVNVQPIVVGDTIFGVDQGGELMGVSIPSGQRVWETPQPISRRPQQSGTAFIVKNGDRFFLFNESGQLIVAKLTASGYEEMDRTDIIKPTNNAFGRDVVWCAPAFADGSLFVRNDEEIIRVSLTK